MLCKGPCDFTLYTAFHTWAEHHIPVSASVGLASKIPTEGSYAGTRMPEKAMTYILNLLCDKTSASFNSIAKRRTQAHSYTILSLLSSRTNL